MGIVATYHQITREEAAACGTVFWALFSCCEDAKRLHCDIGKEWSALHFVLTGSTSPCTDEPYAAMPVIESPCSAAIFGQRIQIGEGCFAGLTSPEKASEIAHALAVCDIDAKLRDMDASAFAKLDDWDSEEEHAMEPDILRRYFAALRDFYLAAEADGSAVLTTFI